MSYDYDATPGGFEDASMFDFPAAMTPAHPQNINNQVEVRYIVPPLPPSL